MNKQTFSMIKQVKSLGIAEDDAWKLRAISMTLHRWHEMQCGTDNGCIERDGRRQGNGAPFWRYSDGKRGPFMADKEAGALKRLAAIMAKYPTLQHYVQGDPRGAALYILRPGDVPAPVYKNVDAYYSRGIAVYK